MSAALVAPNIAEGFALAPKFPNAAPPNEGFVSGFF